VLSKRARPPAVLVPIGIGIGRCFGSRGRKEEEHEDRSTKPLLNRALITPPRPLVAMGSTARVLTAYLVASAAAAAVCLGQAYRDAVDVGAPLTALPHAVAAASDAFEARRWQQQQQAIVASAAAYDGGGSSSGQTWWRSAWLSDNSGGAKTALHATTTAAALSASAAAARALLAALLRSPPRALLADALLVADRGLLQTELGALVAANLALALYGAFALATARVFLGELSPRESARMTERLVKYAVFKVVFVGSAVATPRVLGLGAWLAWFVAAGHAKLFMGAARDRLEALAAAPAAPRRAHLRAVALLLALLAQGLVLGAASVAWALSSSSSSSGGGDTGDQAAAAAATTAAAAAATTTTTTTPPLLAPVVSLLSAAAAARAALSAARGSVAWTRVLLLGFDAAVVVVDGLRALLRYGATVLDQAAALGGPSASPLAAAALAGGESAFAAYFRQQGGPAPGAGGAAGDGVGSDDEDGADDQGIEREEDDEDREEEDADEEGESGEEEETGDGDPSSPAAAGVGGGRAAAGAAATARRPAPPPSRLRAALALVLRVLLLPSSRRPSAGGASAPAAAARRPASRAAGRGRSPSAAARGPRADGRSSNNRGSRHPRGSSNTATTGGSFWTTAAGMQLLLLWDGWQGRAAFLAHAELGCELLLHTLTLLHYMHVWLLHGCALHLVDALLMLDARAVLLAAAGRVAAHRRHREATRGLRDSFPDATRDECLAAGPDGCAICRDRMVGGPGSGAKRLPCSHLFHLACLRAWLQQSGASGFSCPVCRLPLSAGAGGAEAEAKRRAAQQRARRLQMQQRMLEEQAARRMQRERELAAAAERAAGGAGATAAPASGAAAALLPPRPPRVLVPNSDVVAAPSALLPGPPSSSSAGGAAAAAASNGGNGGSGGVVGAIFDFMRGAPPIQSPSPQPWARAATPAAAAAPDATPAAAAAPDATRT
jgi:hypothetical protein